MFQEIFLSGPYTRSLMGWTAKKNNLNSIKRGFFLSLLNSSKVSTYLGTIYYYIASHYLWQNTKSRPFFLAPCFHPPRILAAVIVHAEPTSFLSQTIDHLTCAPPPPPQQQQHTATLRQENKRSIVVIRPREREREERIHFQGGRRSGRAFIPLVRADTFRVCFCAT